MLQSRRRSYAVSFLVFFVTLPGADLVASSAAPDRLFRPHVQDERPATANHAQRPRANNSPVLVIDSTEPRFVAMAHRLDSPQFSCALQVSGDGGRGWVPAMPVPRLPPGADTCYNPQVAFAPDGTLHYLFVGLQGPGNLPMGVFLTSSRDRAKTFSRPRRVLGPLKFQVNMVVDRDLGSSGRIHLVWLDARSEPGLGAMPPGPNPILASFSDDGGETFSRPARVSDAARTRVVAPAIALGPNHEVYVIYYDLMEDDRDYLGLEGPVWEGKWALVFSASSEDGRRFSAGMVVDKGVTPPERVMLIFTMPPPSLAVGPGGALVAAWHDARNGDWDAFTRRSSDGGSTWGPVIRLNDDPPHRGRHQYQPRLSGSPGGRIDAVFYDRRDDPDNLHNHVYHAYSNDGGRSFSRNVRITRRPSDTRIGQTYKGPAAQGLTEFGSRIGLASTDAFAVAGWTDTRNVRRTEGEVAIRQDIFTSSISVEVRPKGRNGDLVIPAVFLAGLVVAVVLKLRRPRRPA